MNYWHCFFGSKENKSLKNREMKRFLPELSLFLFILTTSVQAQITYSLVAGSESWPADKRSAIIQAMDEAVDHYNNNGYFIKALTVEYNPNVPTADANFNGRIRFGGSISTRTALHEISHTLGVGTVSQWWARIGSSNTWTGSRANARVQLYNGEGVTVKCDNMHFWSSSGPTYGLNYPREDGSTNRIRHVRMVSALLWDMGLIKDSDNDGLPDDWEMFYFGTLDYNGNDDYNGDGVTNLDNYKADTNPTSKYEWIKVSDRDASVSYDANWGEWPSIPSYNNAGVNYSQITGATATFIFTGTRVRYYGFKRSNLGFADIYINDVLQTSVDCYAPYLEPDVLLYESDILAYGSHTLKVVVRGTKNPSSSGTEVIIDAFEYYEGDLSSAISSDNVIYGSHALKVYPNPVKDVFTLESPGDFVTKVTIFDTLGRRVYQNTFIDRIKIRANEISASGILEIQLEGEGKLYHGKIVIL